jgi:hypothetical protein
MTAEDIQLYVMTLTDGTEVVGTISPMQIRINNETEQVKRQYEFICMEVIDKEKDLDLFNGENSYYKVRKIAITDSNLEKIRKL